MRPDGAREMAKTRGIACVFESRKAPNADALVPDGNNNVANSSKNAKAPIVQNLPSCPDSQPQRHRLGLVQIRAAKKWQNSRCGVLSGKMQCTL